MIEALAWPGTFCAILFVARKELPEIIRSIRKLRFKDVELEFGEAAKAVASEAKVAVPSSASSDQPKDEMTLRLLSIAELAPRAAILEAWLQVEVAAVDAIRKRTSAKFTSMPAPLRLRDGLMQAKILDSRQGVVFDQLRTLRNEAVHFPDAHFTDESIASYIDASLAMASYLKAVVTEP